MPWLVRYRPRSGDRSGNRSGNRVDTAPDAAPADLLDRHATLVSALWDLGTGGVAETPSTLVAGFDRLATARAAADLAEPHDLVADIAAADDSWGRQEAASVDVTTATGPITFPVVPGAAFGHGGHPTTRLCLDLMSRVRLTTAPGDTARTATVPRVLDLGTGSGVLAIAAHHLWAADITASDTDPAAIDSARFNLDANNVDARLIEGDIDEVSAHVDRLGTGFDLIAANLLAVVHEELAADTASLLAPGGTLVLSGFLGEQADRVATVYRNATAPGRPTLGVTERATFDDWCGLVLAGSSAAG